MLQFVKGGEKRGKGKITTAVFFERQLYCCTLVRLVYSATATRIGCRDVMSPLGCAAPSSVPHELCTVASEKVQRCSRS
jgi:hypothetical protein